MGKKKSPLSPKQLKEGLHYYFEGPYMVFTKEYHLLRGYCCESGCRHCPYPSSDEKQD